MNPADFESTFQTLLGEWNEIAGQERLTALVTWAAALEEMSQEEARLRADGLWVRGAADIFGVLGISRAEVRHTKLVAWLMDPAARHGLGTRFLERVLARVFPGEHFEKLGDAHPTCEVVRGECRADIVVKGSAFTLIIEAKVDADESDGQCEYQFEQFASEVGSRFVFLTPRGRPPRTAVTEEAKDAFRSLSFSALRDDLRAALATAPHAAGRGAAVDYLRTLEREFPWPS